MGLTPNIPGEVTLREDSEKEGPGKLTVKPNNNNIRKLTPHWKRDIHYFICIAEHGLLFAVKLLPSLFREEEQLVVVDNIEVSFILIYF